MYDIGTFYCQLFAGIREGAARDIDEAFALARSHGITDVDFNAKEIDADTSALLARTGMCAASVHGTVVCDFENRERYLASLDGMKRAMNKALSVESPYFMCVPLAPSDMTPDKADDFKKAVRELIANVCEYAKNLPITVTVENYLRNDIPFSAYDDIAWLLENNTSLMFTYDSGNFILAGQDELEGARRFSDRTVYVHLKDLALTSGEGMERSGKVYASTYLGGGFVRNIEALKVLRAAGFERGTLTLEVNSSLECFSRTLKSKEWLDAVLTQI